jgi:hypothetical protein
METIPMVHTTAHASRRTFLTRATAASALPLAASLLGTGEAAASGALPDYAPIPEASKGPALNDKGYFAGRIDGDLYWVTDSSYSAVRSTDVTARASRLNPPTDEPHRSEANPIPNRRRRSQLRQLTRPLIQDPLNVGFCLCGLTPVLRVFGEVTRAC